MIFSTEFFSNHLINISLLSKQVLKLKDQTESALFHMTKLQNVTFIFGLYVVKIMPADNQLTTFFLLFE